MIASITGTLLEKHPPSLVMEVNGIGYELEAPMTTFYELPEPGQRLNLFTHLVVREDAQLLYGFSQRRQRDLFRSLLKVSGVGPRVGLAILSGMSAEEFLRCMIDEDLNRLICIPGIGRKTGQRLLVEMRDRVLKQAEGEQWEGGENTGSSVVDNRGEAVNALESLGYKTAQAQKAVGLIEAKDLNSEQIIRQALRNLGGST